MSLYLAIYGDKLTIFDALFISAFAMIVVFLVLLMISYMVDFTAFCINRKKTNVKKEVVNVEKVVENNNTDNTHLVAVITAAIASYMGTSTDNLHIKSIRRINQNNSAWNELNQMF